MIPKSLHVPNPGAKAMGAMVEPSHTSWNRSGVLQYRRRVPHDVRPGIGRTEFIPSFKAKDTDRMALAYPVVRARFEAMIEATQASALGADQMRTLTVLQRAGVSMTARRVSARCVTAPQRPACTCAAGAGERWGRRPKITLRGA